MCGKGILLHVFVSVICILCDTCPVHCMICVHMIHALCDLCVKSAIFGVRHARHKYTHLHKPYLLDSV